MSIQPSRTSMPSRPIPSPRRFLLAVNRTRRLAVVALAWFGMACASAPQLSKVEEAAMCGLIDDFFARSMETAPLYESGLTGCRPVDRKSLDESAQRNLFANAACTEAVEYAGQPWRAFCDDNLLGNERSKVTIGNPDAWTERDPTAEGRIETPWSAAQEARLHLAAVNQTKGQLRPFLKRVEYRRVGDCALGMYIYRQDLDAEDLKPLILIHGGGWKYRGIGAIAGLGTMAPNFTSRGYVVFAPFYRLLKTSDGPAACHGASGAEILEDIEAAFAWVKANGSRYGARDKGPISVAGQSAGGHLAAYLATYHPDEIDRGLLLYPAPDLGFLVDCVQPGGIYAGEFSDGKELLTAFFAQPGVTEFSELDLDDPEIDRNSFPPIIQPDPGSYPTLETLHGAADTTVPVEVSVRLCQALDPDQSPSNERYTGGTDSRGCGPQEGSRLTVVAGADHMLDLRCFTGRAREVFEKISPRLGALCTAGSPKGQKIVRSTLEAAYDRF